MERNCDKNNVIKLSLQQNRRTELALVRVIAIPARLEVYKPGEHAHDAGDLLLAVHGDRVRHVALEIDGDTLRDEGEDGHEVVVVGPLLELVDQRLDEPGTFGSITP